MAWFLRRAIPLGKFLRLNLSKRGLGASLGVKGLRIGIDSAGKPYVSGGRGGIYFRQRLGARQDEVQTSADPGPAGPRLPWLELVAWLAVVFGVAVVGYVLVQALHEWRG